MEQKLKNLLKLYEEIVAEGDQGETFDAIDRALQEHPHYVDDLKRIYLDETDEDRKNILLNILEFYVSGSIKRQMSAQSIAWERYSPEFTWDGSWRDIYVLDTTIADWQILLDFLRVSDDSIRYTSNGEDTPLPVDANAFFDNHTGHGSELTFDTLSIRLTCHFFTDDEIEFDFDPRQVTVECVAEEIFTFMGTLGLLLGKPVRMTPENDAEKPIFEYDPDGSTLHYFPIGNPGG